MTFTDAAHAILKESGKPMHVREITKQALQRGLIVTEGETPEQTMSARIQLEAKHVGGRFACLGENMIALKEWAAGGVSSASAPASDITQTVEELARIQAESERQALPEQKRVFMASERIRRKVHNLPDPARAPIGFDPKKAYDRAFPNIRLPRLHPVNHGDTVIFNAPDLPANQLILGDNLHVLRSLPSESIDLIYIDPPFFSGRNYNVIWGDTNEVRSFHDVWEGGIDSYLVWLNARLWEMRRVLQKTGSIYVHCDWHASHYVKCEMDKIFGYEHFRNEIVWHYSNSGLKAKSKKFHHKHDVILFYSKGSEYVFNGFKESLKDGDSGKRRSYKFDSKSKKALPVYDEEGRPVYYHVEGILAGSVWSIPILQGRGETIGYPTQKPEALLERVIKASSNEGDVIADFFCGGGTTLAVVQKLRRGFIGCDSSRIAIAVTLDRLVKIGEELSGVQSNLSAGEAFAQKLQIGGTQKVSNIELSYLGTYPIDKFENLPHSDFVEFVLTCYGASRNTADGIAHGFRPPGQSEPILVGPSHSKQSVDSKEVKAFFDEIKSRLEPNKPVRAKVLGWRFSPQVQQYVETLRKYVLANKLLAEDGETPLIDIELIPLRSDRFREHVLQRYPDVEDADFYLRFPEPPVIGDIRVKKVGDLEYEFEAVDAIAVEADGWLVNCQWDFDYQAGHFAADKDYVLSREKAKDKQRGEHFVATLTAKHKFDKSGEYTIACKVQDNLAGEKTFAKNLIAV